MKNYDKKSNDSRLKLKSLLKILLFPAILASCDISDMDDNYGICAINCGDFTFMRIDSEPAWSPDGKQIAFIHGSSEPGVSGIYLIEANGNNRHQIHTGTAGGLSWSPDGEWIAFHQNAQIFKLHVKKGSLIKLTNEGRNFYPAWSPDGKWIAYHRSLADKKGPAGVWIMKPNGSGKKAVFGGAFPDWHSKGNKIMAVVGVSPYSIWKQFIQSNPFSGSPSDTLNAVIDADNRYPVYSPNGQKIMFTSQPSGGGYPQLWIMRSDDSDKMQLTENGGWIGDWSPHGKWIVYTETYDTGRLWLMRPDGSEKRQLTYE